MPRLCFPTRSRGAGSRGVWGARTARGERRASGTDALKSAKNAYYKVPQKLLQCKIA